MKVTWGLLAALSLLCHAESRCSPTSYYKNCWIRRFPGIFIDLGASERRGAQLLRSYQEETALTCSRTCCLTANFSCNLAIFHYDTSQENVNCFHLHCPTLESCILSHRGNVVLYNITKGVDPDLLVFGKSFTSNVRVLPHHYSRVNASEPLPSDKRQFFHPPPPAVLPLTSAPTVKAPVNVSRVLPTTTTTTTTTQPTTSPATTAAPSSTSSSPTVTGHRAQTTPPATSTTSPTPSSNVPLSSTTLSRDNTQTTPAFSTTTAQLSTSAPAHHSSATFSPTANSPPASSESSDQYSNDTSGVLDAGWQVATHSLLVAVAICVTVLLSCCCSILLVVSWRGQRKRMGRYRTSWRGKTGSMRLIKYVLVRESS
ncbi:hypothetical protein Q5P01_012747 [Channa striata]|uniref:MANSC domain-containing protein n=1 Tax=Channa striata TaxID=64152 RepID=A0AA88MQ49_CHASR|nr:hypothetical protein Q5P01_012747 [Channa striata]